MAEENTASQQGTDGQSTPAGFSPITTQEEYDRVAARIRRSAKADYDDLKAKAEMYDKLVEDSKSELQKAMERSAKAEKELEALKKGIAMEKAKADIAKEFGIDADILRGSDEKELREHAEAIKSHVSLYPNTKDRGEGNRTPNQKVTKQEFVANIFKKE